MRTYIPLLVTLLAAGSLKADPLTDNWLTAYAGKYARLYTSDANKLAGTSVTTWTNGTQTQTLPVYCGVQQVSYSASWVYIKTSGLATHTMGPWYGNAAHTTTFPNLPKNQNVTWRFPRVPVVPATKTLTGLGTIGYFVDGVAMFDSRDGFYWNGSAETGGAGTGSWERDAWINEGVTFDPGQAHQEQSGTYHYHANPVALRYLLGDHVDFNTSTKTYTESIAPVTKHSPLLGFCRDGYPVYGPYGYASATNPASGVRRMVSGFVLRNGSNGTDNLTSTGRTAVPAWATRAGNPAGSGPAVSTTYSLGRYMQDNAYLGDLGRTQGTDFDLDEYNGRTCVTPEYPQGTYAYFVAIKADGSPAFPYNIGRAYRGTPSGGAATIAETVTTKFTGVTGIAEGIQSVSAASPNITLTWNSVEGGTYQVEASNTLSGWAPLTPTVTAASGAVSTTATVNGAMTGSDRRFFKISRTALANYDGGTTGGGGGTGAVAPGGSAARGTTVAVTITLPATPPNPPVNVQPTGVTLAGSIAGTSVSRPAQNSVLATFAIPAGAPTGLQNIVVTFTTPNGTISYTVTFTIT